MRARRMLQLCQAARDGREAEVRRVSAAGLAGLRTLTKLHPFTNLSFLFKPGIRRYPARVPWLTAQAVRSGRQFEPSPQTMWLQQPSPRVLVEFVRSGVYPTFAKLATSACSAFSRCRRYYTLAVSWLLLHAACYRRMNHWHIVALGHFLRSERNTKRE